MTGAPSGQLARTQAERITISTSSGPVAALRCGHAGDPDVLLLPGYTGSKEDFAPLLDPLAEAGYRLTCIDLPGQFESPGSAELADYTTDALGAVVRGVADTLDTPVHLVGHSFGGLVARAAVIAQPAGFADLVLMDSGPAALTGARRQRIEQLAPVLPSGLIAVYAAMQAALQSESGYLPPPAELATFLRNRFLAGNPAMLQGMGDALRAEPDRVAELADTGVAVLVVHGARDDAWVPAVQAEMATRLGAQYVVIPDAAHSPAVENTAATIEALLRFWTR